MKMHVDQIYICHYSKLTDRKQFILKQLQDFGVTNYQFVEHYDKDTIDNLSISIQYPLINHPENKMTSAEKSLTLKHVWIIKDMLEKKYSSVLVLEDDAVLCKNFIKHFNKYKSQMAEDWDIGWVGSCFNLRESQVPNVNVYKTDRGSRCTHAFCISNRFAHKVSNEISNVYLPSDHYYNYLVKKFSLNNYWFQPPLATQSLNHPSSLSGKYWDESIVN